MLLDPLTQKAIHETESPIYVYQIALSQDAKSLLVVGHHRTAEWSLLRNSRQTTEKSYESASLGISRRSHRTASALLLCWQILSRKKWLRSAHLMSLGQPTPCCMLKKVRDYFQPQLLINLL